MIGLVRLEEVLQSLMEEEEVIHFLKMEVITLSSLDVGAAD